MAQKINIENYDFGQWCKLYSKCMDLLNKIYTRWYGSCYGVTHYDVRHLTYLISEGKTSFSRYERELNDKIYFDQYGKHLYKNMEGKNVNDYIL